MAEEPSQVLCFTDPSLLGHTNKGGNPYFTSTGDVDDVACLLYLAQTHGPRITFYICDDASMDRFRQFMLFIGDDVKRTYGCKIESQMKLSAPGEFGAPDLTRNTIVHLHAPISTASCQYLHKNSAKISRFFTQGSTAGDTNFKTSPPMWELVQMYASRTTMFTSADTNFTIVYNGELAASLNEKSRQVYEDYFTFQTRKQFGLAIGVPGLNDRLYSDTGFNGGVGNGIKAYKPLIAHLRAEGAMPDPDSEAFMQQLGVCNEIVERMYAATGGSNPSTLANLKDLVWLLKKYCDYDSLLVLNQTVNHYFLTWET